MRPIDFCCALLDADAARLQALAVERRSANTVIGVPHPFTAVVVTV